MRSSSSCQRISKNSSSFLVLDSGYEVTMRIDRIDWTNRIKECRGFLGFDSKVDDSPCFSISILSVSCSRTASTFPDRLFMQIRCSRLPDKMFRSRIPVSFNCDFLKTFLFDTVYRLLYRLNYQSKMTIQLAI